jgi:hypothetical protein
MSVGQVPDLQSLYYYPSFCLQPATILVGQAVSPVIAIQSHAREQAIFGCVEAALWGGHSWLQPAFQPAP